MSANWQLYRRLLQYVRPYRSAFIASLVCMVAASALEPALSKLIQLMVDEGFGPNPSHAVYFYPAVMVGLHFIRALLTFVCDYAMAWVANKVVMDLRNHAFASLIKLPTRFFDDSSSGALMSKVAYDVQGVMGAASSAITTLVSDSVRFVALLGFLFYLNWKLTLIVCAMLPLVAVAVRAFSSRLRTMARAAQKSMGMINHVLEESISAHKLIKIFGGQRYEQERFEEATKKQRGYVMRGVLATAGQSPIVQTLSAITLGCIFAVALWMGANKEITIGEFLAFITAIAQLMPSIKRLSDVNSQLQKGLASAESVFELIDQPAEADQGPQQLGRAQGRVRFDNVSFRYPEASKDALSQITLDIRPGEMVALVGPSGSGKTTIANLLPRFYPVNSGSILIDEQPLEQIQLNSLRDNIALVSQDVVLFNDTIAANIAYGRLADVSREQILAAAQAAHALNFIEQQSDGLDTLIGENGVKLSGGQRQRLAIARALLKDAPILILDEATSALDTESERHVQAALDTLMQGRTTLVIAHRLSTIERADRIVVLDRGRIVEQGTHQQLLAQNGQYAHVWAMQFSQEEQARQQPES